VSRLRGKIGRFVALLALVSGLVGSVILPEPSFAVPSPDPDKAHAAMDCSDMHHQTPTRHLPAGADCCVANICAMNLALPASPLGIALPTFFEPGDYDFQPLRQPAGIDPAPIPHPPKFEA